MVEKTLIQAPYHKMGIALLIATIFLLSGCESEKAETPARDVVRPVKLYKVSSKKGQGSFSLPGVARAAERTELSFKVSGPLDKLVVEEGQFVKKGELIARISPRDFSLAIKEAKAREVEAEQQYKRYRELYTRRQASKADFDRYRAAREVAKAQLLDSQNALKDTQLVAPFEGVIARRLVENFEKVQAHQPIVNLQRIDQLEVVIDLPETLMSSITKHAHYTTTAQFDAVPNKEYSLKLKEYSTEADSATHTYRVVLLMDQAEEALILPGMTAKVQATHKGDNDVSIQHIEIPAIAVLAVTDGNGDENGQIWLFDRKTMTVTRKVIQTGSLTGTDSITVISGLEVGDEIVIAGMTKLKEGQHVRPWEGQKERTAK